MYQYLTRILLCSLLMLCATGAKGQSSTLPFNELNEVINLYCDGQYNIVKAKLGNLGFIVTKSTPDYSLDGVTHSGDFVMMREKTSSIEAFRMHGFKDVDRFFFSTVIRHSQVSGYVHTRTMDISFNYSEAGAVGVYDTYKRFWNGNIDTITCQKYSHNRVVID